MPGAEQGLGNGPVAILGGTGDLGLGLALRLAREGVHVVIGSRSAERAAAAADRVREAVPDAPVDGLVNPEAAAGAGTVVLSVPFASQAGTLKAVAESLTAEQLVIDATVPLATAVGGRASRPLGVWQGSAAQQAQELVPDGVAVVAALHTVSAAHLADLEYELDEHVLVCGNRKADKQHATDLIERIQGLRCIDCGRLEMARVLEQLTPLLIGINSRYKTTAGIRITGVENA